MEELAMTMDEIIAIAPVFLACASVALAPAMLLTLVRRAQRQKAQEDPGDGSVIACRECGARKKYLVPHLRQKHSMTKEEYWAKFAPVISEKTKAYQAETVRAGIADFWQWYHKK